MNVTFIKTIYKGDHTTLWAAGKIAAFDCFEVEYNGMKSYIFAPQYSDRTSAYYRRIYEDIVPCIPNEEYIKAILRDHKAALAIRQLLEYYDTIS